MKKEREKYEITRKHISTEISLCDHNIRDIPEFCFEENCIYELDLSKNAISYISAKIKNLRLLTSINLNFNRILAIPNIICELPYMKELHLSNNMLSDLPNEFQKLQNLQELDLSSNKFRCIPVQVMQIRCLRVLTVANNLIESISEDMGKMEELRVFDISSNFITELPETMLNLCNLETFACDGNPLTCPPLTVVSHGLPHIMAYLAAQSRNRWNALSRQLSVRSEVSRSSAIKHLPRHQPSQLPITCDVNLKLKPSIKQQESDSGFMEPQLHLPDSTDCSIHLSDHSSGNSVETASLTKETDTLTTQNILENDKLLDSVQLACAGTDESRVHKPDSGYNTTGLLGFIDDSTSPTSEATQLQNEPKDSSPSKDATLVADGDGSTDNDFTDYSSTPSAETCQSPSDSYPLNSSISSTSVVPDEQYSIPSNKQTTYRTNGNARLDVRFQSCRLHENSSTGSGEALFSARFKPSSPSERDKEKVTDPLRSPSPLFDIKEVEMRNWWTTNHTVSRRADADVPRLPATEKAKSRLLSSSSTDASTSTSRAVTEIPCRSGASNQRKAGRSGSSLTSTHSSQTNKSLGATTDRRVLPSRAKSKSAVRSSASSVSQSSSSSVLRTTVTYRSTGHGALQQSKPSQSKLNYPRGSRAGVSLSARDAHSHRIIAIPPRNTSSSVSSHGTGSFLSTAKEEPHPITWNQLTKSQLEGIRYVEKILGLPSGRSPKNAAMDLYTGVRMIHWLNQMLKPVNIKAYNIQTPDFRKYGLVSNPEFIKPCRQNWHRCRELMLQRGVPKEVIFSTDAILKLDTANGLLQLARSVFALCNILQPAGGDPSMHLNGTSNRSDKNKITSHLQISNPISPNSSPKLQQTVDKMNPDSRTFVKESATWPHRLCSDI